MELQTILEILQNGLTLLVGGLVLYFKFSSKAQTKAKQVQETIAQITAQAVIFIKEAEETYKDTTDKGGEKFEFVVNKLFDIVPAPLHSIITIDMIEDIVQSTFNEIEEYVKLQLDTVIEKSED